MSKRNSVTEETPRPAKKLKAGLQSTSGEEKTTNPKQPAASTESTELIPRIDDKVCLREDTTKTGYVEDAFTDDELGSFLLVDEEWVYRSEWMVVMDKNGKPVRAPQITISFPSAPPLPVLTTEEIERRNERTKKRREETEKSLQMHEEAFQNLPANKKEIVDRIRQICGRKAVLIWKQFAGDNYLCTLSQGSTNHLKDYGKGSLPLKKLLDQKNAYIMWEYDNYFIVPNVYFTNPDPTETCDVNVNVLMDYEDDDAKDNSQTGSLYARIDIVWPKKMIDCGFAYFMMKKIEDALGNNCESELADEVNALAKEDFLSQLSHVSPAFNKRKDFRVELGMAVYFDRKESLKKKGFFEMLDLNSEYGIQIVKEYQFYTSAVLSKIFEKYFKGPTAASKNWVYQYDHPCHASFWERIIPKYKNLHELPISFKEEK